MSERTPFLKQMMEQSGMEEQFCPYCEQHADPIEKLGFTWYWQCEECESVFPTHY